MKKVKNIFLGLCLVISCFSSTRIYATEEQANFIEKLVKEQSIEQIQKNAVKGDLNYILAMVIKLCGENNRNGHKRNDELMFWASNAVYLGNEACLNILGHTFFHASDTKESMIAGFGMIYAAAACNNSCSIEELKESGFSKSKDPILAEYILEAKNYARKVLTKYDFTPDYSIWNTL